MRAFGLVGVITSYIVSPLVILGGIGWFLSGVLGSQVPLYSLLIVAFCLSNFILVRRAPRDLARFSKFT